MNDGACMCIRKFHVTHTNYQCWFNVNNIIFSKHLELSPITAKIMLVLNIATNIKYNFYNCKGVVIYNVSNIKSTFRCSEMQHWLWHSAFCLIFHIRIHTVINKSNLQKNGKYCGLQHQKFTYAGDGARINAIEPNSATAGEDAIISCDWPNTAFSSNDDTFWCDCS